MKNRLNRRLLTGMLAGTFLLTAAGCLVTAGSAIEVSGTRVTDSTFTQVEVGTTTETWLLATLGAPSECTEVADSPGVKILRYDYQEVHHDRGTVFLIFSGRSKKQKLTRTYFEVTDGVVSRYWSEH